MQRYAIINDDNADKTVALDGAYADDVTTELTNYLEKFDGWFEAPGSGSIQVRFYMSCDDDCKLEFDSSTPYGSGSQSLSNILEVTSAMTYRNYNSM